MQHFLSIQNMLTFSNFLFLKLDPCLLEQVLSLFNNSSSLIFHQNLEENIIYQFQSTKYLCEPQVSEIVDVPKTLTSWQPSNFYCCSVYILHNKWQMSRNAAVFNKLHSIKPSLGEWQPSYRIDCKEEVTLARLRIGPTF